MIDNYPDNAPASLPSAPWNQSDEPELLRCSECDHEPEDGEAVVGDRCNDGDTFCDGRYVSQRCDQCNGYGIHCNCE